MDHGRAFPCDPPAGVGFKAITEWQVMNDDEHVPDPRPPKVKNILYDWDFCIFLHGVPGVSKL